MTQTGIVQVTATVGPIPDWKKYLWIILIIFILFGGASLVKAVKS